MRSCKDLRPTPSEAYSSLSKKSKKQSRDLKQDAILNHCPSTDRIYKSRKNAKEEDEANSDG